MNKVSRKSKMGFTLVELLVVIGIIALLISILLPTLGRARRAANTVACAANLRSILQAVQMYASQNNGSIPGSPWTTARGLYKDMASGTLVSTNPDQVPGVIDTFDWASPIMKVMGVKFNEGPLLTDRLERTTKVRAF